jgi:hypothetical protein
MNKGELALLEKQHQWRELLQKQLAEHYLTLYCPDSPEDEKNKPISKIRGQGGKVA